MTLPISGSRLRAGLQRHRHLGMVGGAVVCAAIAVHAGSRYLDDRLEAERARLTPPPVPMESLVVARRDLAKGDPVTADTMAVRSVPRMYAMSSAVRPAQFDTYQGARLAVAMRAGEPLLDSAVIGNDQAGFSQRLRPGVRALTLAVDDVNAIAGLLQPGDRVDLFFSARPPAGKAAAPGATESTVALLQNVLVLATGRQVRPVGDQQASGRSYGTITVEVAPQQAQRIVVAQRTGRLTAVLRHPDDRRLEAASRMDLGQLFGGVEEPRRTPPRGPQMIVGGLGRLPSAGAAAPTPPSPPTPPTQTLAAPPPSTPTSAPATPTPTPATPAPAPATPSPGTPMTSRPLQPRAGIPAPSSAAMMLPADGADVGTLSSGSAP